MRDYGRIAPTFWTRGTGKSLRGDSTAQLVALYLMTAPTANMIGLYYLPVQTIAHDIGSPLEGAWKALRRLIEGGLCSYSEGSETVFVRTMARRQLGLEPGEGLQPRDKRIGGIVRLMHECSDAALLQAFWTEYRAAFHLPEPWWTEAPSEALASPLEGPSMPLRSQDQDQEQEQAQEQEPSALGFAEPRVAPKRGRPKRDPEPSLPETPAYSETVKAYFEEYERAKGTKPPFGSRDGASVKKLLEAFGGDVARARQCIHNALTDPYCGPRATICSIAADPAKHDGTPGLGKKQLTIQPVARDANGEGFGERAMRLAREAQAREAAE